MIVRLSEWLSVILESTGVAGITLAMMLESACIPLPSEVILPFAGILVRQGSLTFPTALAWAVGGQLWGSLLTYYVGRSGGRRLIERYGKYLLIREHELAIAERWFQRYGEGTVFVARLLPGVRTFISLPAGVARMPLWRFTLYSLLGLLPWTALLIWLGVKVGKVWTNPFWHPYFQALEIGVIAALALLGLIYLSKRIRIIRRR